MKIISYKPGHDGHVSYLNDDELIFSIEAEKDNGERYAGLTPKVFVESLKYVDDIPDVFAISGWGQNFQKKIHNIEGGYFGHESSCIIDRNDILLGKKVKYFSSSHERAHILSSYAMSPFPQGKPCYALVWEGKIGAFYKIDERLDITKIGDVLERPGHKYAFIYALADPTFKTQRRFEDAGKLMALVSFGLPYKSSTFENELMERVLNHSSVIQSDGSIAYPNLNKMDFLNNPLFNAGLESQTFKNFAKMFSENLFNKFSTFAKVNLTKGLPLLISGGCGLNCDWNSAWKDLGLFEDVFVPPCTNDSGSAIGTAVDALFQYSGKAKIKWTVYAGEEFVHDIVDIFGFDILPFDAEQVAKYIADGKIIGWIQGKYEIGPRALGNRSILASPLIKDIQQRLNNIKRREGFRPIAPICLEEDIHRHFENAYPSPHMLYFQKVKTDALPGVTHVDKSARFQSVNLLQNKEIYNLLLHFKKETGYGVLCNTSLNFNGAGFINRMSDLVEYTHLHGLDGFVVGNVFYKHLK